jgi:hypothetical protein
MLIFRLSICAYALFGILTAQHAFGAAQELADTTEFALVRNSNGINIYERWYSITGGRQAREVKAVFTVEAEPAAALALIKDDSRGREWNSGTKSYSVVPAGAGRWICHIEYDFPWPLSNQDCVLQYTEKCSADGVEICFRGADHPSFPVRKRVQRIPDIRGKWVLKKSRQGTAVEYFITTKPSETFPAWVTDPVVRGNLLETLDSFRQILQMSGN